MTDPDDYEEAFALMDRLPFASGVVYQYVQVASEKAIQNDDYPCNIKPNDMHEAAVFMAEETVKNSGVVPLLGLNQEQRSALHNVIAAGIEISMTCALRWKEVRDAGRPD